MKRLTPLLATVLVLLLCNYNSVDAYIVMNKCADIISFVKRNRNTVGLFYDGFTNKKRTLQVMEDGYSDVDVKFIAVDISVPELRQCVNEIGVQDFPAFALFDPTGGSKVAFNDPSEDRIKRMLNNALSQQPDYQKYYVNQVFQLSQAYDRNLIAQRALPTTFQAKTPGYKNMLPSTWVEHFPPANCYSQCYPCDACQDKHGNIPSGGCGGCGGCGGY